MMRAVSRATVQFRLAVALLVGLSGQAIGGALSCGDGAFAIDAPSEALGSEICDDLLDAREMMLGCGLVQDRPIAVEVMHGISHPIGTCLSYFDCSFDVIRITEPGAFGDALPPDDPYALLPAEVLLASLLAHELAHALVAQTAGDREIDIVDQEYIAAALELEHMDAAWREVLIGAAPVSLPPKPGLIDIWIYGMAPRKFATNAWQHFRLEGNGCALVAEIVAGRFSFAR